ncbi:hypothetical protein GcC1_068022 [Golovinomyces cichoracearum]|uniref:Uncharacterized protein n=1 Tax=Golovinomyces cichoracearum TaxID=62708 RepID=A0A420IQS5_9PEZI|nr:hypothetical protein GcC1_068022 [Golovinomyces cichoracearum]
MSSVPKDFLWGIDTENIMLQPRRQSPQKENQTAQTYSTTLSTPLSTPSSPTSITLKSPPPLSHKKLPPKLPNAMGSEYIASII